MALAAGAADVSSVRVEFDDKFGQDPSGVLMRCRIKAGAAYDAAIAAADVRALLDSGAFENVSLDTREQSDATVEVVFRVKRKLRFQGPLIVKGNDNFSASKISSVAELNDGELYGESDLAVAAGRVRSFYFKKHYPQAKVTPEIQPLGEGGNCSLAFIIDEGPRAKIVRYDFKGADEAELAPLRECIGSYPWWNPIGWFMDSPITADQLAESAEKAAVWYREQGYLDAKVDGPELVVSGDGESVAVYTVEKGMLYHVRSFEITGLKLCDNGWVASRAELPAVGCVAGAKMLADASHRIATAVGSTQLGLADTRVAVRTIPCDDNPSQIGVVFSVEEGVPVTVNQIRIVGNDYTKDAVIRREIELDPGKPMLADRAERSKKKLEQLDYFSRVGYKLVPTALGKDARGAEYRDLVFEVEEKNTGNFMFGVGASSVDSIYLSVEAQQSNFDLFAPGKLFRGAGQKGRISVQAGPRIQTYLASVTEPYLFGRELELTVEGYRRQRWYDEYDVIRSGADASISYPVKFWPTWSAFGRFGMRLSGEFIEFDDMDRGYWLYSGKQVSLAERGGENDRYGDAAEAVLRFFWSRNTCDSYRMPTKGNRTQVFADLGGGDNTYYRLGINHRSYFTVLERYRHVLMLALRAETIDAFSDEVPIYNRFFLGGPRSIRGIEYRNVSPMARKIHNGVASDDWTPWGGQTLFCVNAEYTVPVFKMLRIAAFTDLGSVSPDEFDLDFSDTFAWTAGLGIRLDIPSFPIRLDFAAPFKKPDHADEEVFSFTVGFDF